MKKIFCGLVLLVLVGCGPANYTEVISQASRAGFNYTALAESRNLVGQNVGAYGISKVSQEHANSLAMSFCQNNYRDCVFTYEGSNWILDKKEEKTKNQKVDNADELMNEKNLKVKEKELTIVQLDKLYSETCGRKNKKGSDKYNNCLLEKQTEAKQIAEKLAKMSPDDRRAYTCTEKFGFRKGSDNFKDCVFKIYSAEIELEKIELQKQLAKANADLAKANAASNEKLANAQTNAAIMQAYAAQQQAIAANTADSLALMESGLRMMSPQRPASRAPMNCQYHAKMLSCF
jgi:CRISPR/Cas system CSM-associated protein Csm2 small subunit